LNILKHIMRPLKSALLVIDVQHGLFDETPRPYEAAAVIARINGLTEKARCAKVPVVFIQHERPSGFLEQGSDSWQLQADLVVVAGDVKIRKTTPDSFLRTNLAELLSSWGTEEITICGYASEFCVDTTTRRAAALGYPVVLVADAHTTHDKDHATAQQIRAHHNATLSNIASFGPPIKAMLASEIAFGG